MRLPVLFTLLLSLPASAQLRAPRLDGPEITVMSWDTFGSAPIDMDGDGRVDLPLINNETAKITVLYQRGEGQAKTGTTQRIISRNRWEPQLEDARFQKTSLPTDQRHYAMATADFDGDGRPDFALTGATDALLVRFQGKDATFSKSWKYDNFEPIYSSTTILAHDLDADGKSDLAILAKGKLLIFRQKPTGGLADPVIYSTGHESAAYLMADDTDGDGIVDLMYMDGEGEGSLHLRRGTGDAAFASEVLVHYPRPRYALHRSRDAAGRLVFTKVASRSELIERHTLKMQDEVMRGDKLVATAYTAPGASKGAHFTRGDINGDGLDDVAQADAKAAQVVLYLQQENGTFAEPLTFPSLSGINGVAAISQGSGKAAVLAVISEKEGLGISALNAQGRLDFPTVLPQEGAPAALATTQSDPALPARLHVVSGSNRSWTLSSWTRGAEGPWTSSTQALSTIQRDPTGMKSADLNGDGAPDLLITLSKDPAAILLAKKGTPDFTAPLTPTAVMKSQLSDTNPERITLSLGQPRATILTSGAGYARALQLTPDDKDLLIADQYNARQADDKLTTPLPADIDGDGTDELVFAESSGAHLQVMKKDAGGVYRADRRLETSTTELTALHHIHLGKAKVPHLLMLGKDRFWTAPLSGTAPRMELISSYETDLKDCSYYHVITGDLNNDGQEDVSVFDSDAHVLEVLALPKEPSQPWTSLLHFPLFEENIHFRGRKGELNVRDAHIRDFTGDGRADLLILLHDRVLLYPQAP